MADKIKDLEKLIKYSFKNNILLQKSITHKSSEIVKRTMKN